MTTPETLNRLRDFHTRYHLPREDADALNIAIAVMERAQEQRDSSERPQPVEKIAGRKSEPWRSGI